MTTGEQRREETSDLRLSDGGPRPGQITVELYRTPQFNAEIVASILRRSFRKSEESAWEIVETVRRCGHAECGAYSREIAETMVDEVKHEASRRQIMVDMRLHKSKAHIKRAN